MSNINVIKRNGNKEELNLDKIHKVVFWSCEGISGVSPSEIEIKSQLSFYDNIKTTDIQHTLVKSAADLITEDTPNYAYVAGRLINYNLRKEIFGDFLVGDLYEHVNRVIDEGYYDYNLIASYSKEEFDELNNYIDHDRDFDIAYAGMEQLQGKYLIKNRNTGKIYETPQLAFMLIAMTVFVRYKNDRLTWIKRLYDALSTFTLSLPTPIMAGARSPDKQWASCTLIETDDNLDSIIATTGAIVKYVSARAGIGIGAGSLRAIGSPIRNGKATHTGDIPFYKLFSAAVNSCSQGSIRQGAATLYYPIWHLEVEDLLVLKNNKGTEDNRVRRMDYGVQVNRLMYERLIEGKNITLFSPSDVPGLYDAFYANQEHFKELYEKAERNPKIRKKTIPAIKLFSAFMQERKDTGRIYLMNVDNVNTQGSFIASLAPVHQSNLCAEVVLPTKPLNNINDIEGEVATCVLAAINWGKIRKPEDFKEPCTLAVRALDEVIDLQDYPVEAARVATQKRRYIGIGILGLAHWIAKNDLTYQDIDEAGLAKLHEYTEAWAYYITEASIDLAAEMGPCEAFLDTRYARSEFPINLYKDTVDDLVKPEYKYNWEELRKKLKRTGIRNSALMAVMPGETSSQISNETNGIEPPRALVSVKQSKDGVLRQVVPEIRKLKNKYDLLWDQKSPEGYLKICAVIQKFIDQAISVNTSYNPKFYEGNEIPMSVLLRDMLNFYKWGGKDLYYFNVTDHAGEIPIEFALEPIVDHEYECDACKL